MPMNADTVIRKVNECPENHARSFCGFRNWLLNSGTAERTVINYLKVLYLFSRSIGKKDLAEVIEDDFFAFLDSRKKSIEDDPEQRWIKTWNDYLGRLIGFYRWFYNKDRNLDRNQWETPAIFSNIKKKKTKRQSPYSPSDVWTQEEILVAANHCNSIRDKAIITLMFDIAARNHEITKLRIRDIVFKENYAEVTIPWDTKTGSRTIPLGPSFPFVRDWLNEHPFRKNPKAYLFVSKTSNKPLKPESLWNITHNLSAKIQKMLNDGPVNEDERKILESIVKKPSNPYLIGRHSSLTEKINILTDYQWTNFAGLSYDTKRRPTYIHMSGKEISGPLLDHYGIAKQEKPRPINCTCPRCEWINPSGTKLCSKCSYIIDPQTWEDTKKEEQNMKSTLNSLTKRVEEQGQVLKYFTDVLVSNPNVFPNNDEGYLIAEVLKFMGKKQLHNKAMKKLKNIYESV